MATIEAVTIETPDPAVADRFHTAVLGDTSWLHARHSGAPTDGFRGFTLSLVVAGPATVDALMERAVGAGAATVQPAKKSLWGYGGVLQAPDGTLWTVASSSKKGAGPATDRVDDVVLQLGVEDVAASRDFYVERGFGVAKSYGRRYVELEASGPVRLSLYRRKALAKVAGVPGGGSGSHRLAITSDAGPFTDPDGYVWEPAPR